MAHFLDLDGLQTLWNSIVAKIGSSITTALQENYGHMRNISMTIAGQSSGTINLKPNGTYSVWLVVAGYNSASAIYDYVGLVFIGTSTHVMDIAKGASSNLTITIASDGTATVTNGVSTYARVGFTRVYRSDS